MWKRISNGEVIDLTTPQYVKQEGIYGYLLESNGKVYWIYMSDDTQICNDMTQYFEKL